MPKTFATEVFTKKKVLLQNMTSLKIEAVCFIILPQHLVKSRHLINVHWINIYWVFQEECWLIWNLESTRIAIPFLINTLRWWKQDGLLSLGKGLWQATETALSWSRVQGVVVELKVKGDWRRRAEERRENMKDKVQSQTWSPTCFTENQHCLINVI